MMRKSWLKLLLAMLFISFSAWGQDLKSGHWRFELKTEHATIPFIAELTLNEGKLSGAIHNGKETIPLKNVTYSNKKISIPLQTYEISLELKQESPTELTGFWVRHNKKPKIEIPITGLHGQTERFPGKKDRPRIDLTGTWAIELMDEQSQKSEGIAVFEQKGDTFTGSILTPTGDYRYLEGRISGQSFEGASFDGVFNYLLKGQLIGKNLQAKLMTTYVTRIEGKKDPTAKLPDAYKATQLEKKMEFSFPDLKGNNISLNDPRFKNKPVIIQLFGSWCPNCIDEMNYLIPWYKENHQRGIEIIALAFERSLSPADAKKQLLKVQKRNQLPYTLLIAGQSSSDKPEEKIPGLKNFISFPTTIFLNKAHEVVKVHAGFTGPGTGKFFETWTMEFNQTVDELLR